MFTLIGSHFPLVVMTGMSIFAIALAGFSIEDAVKARGPRRGA
ncbi:MAG TPA: hypothetical protein VF475_02435 [Sphingobium sp.]